ncbi:RDD family protein [Agromyces sp. CCNWLW213]|uniref:RDD family protein n=2 Tax=unclassified Agromyces TaxID=2639701 RepID=UPI0030763D48
MSQPPADPSGDLEPSRYPGERLGLPEEGAGSVARFGRRFTALLVDWAIANVIALLAGPYASNEQSWATLGLFALMQVLFIPTIGGSIGHRALGLRVVPLGGGWVGAWRPVVRTLLLVVVIPAVIWDSDQRGLHDRAAGTVLIRG